jgi:hypothetical protein
MGDKVEVYCRVFSCIVVTDSDSRVNIKMAYTLDHVIAECLSDKFNSKTVRDQILRDDLYYQSCWESLNKWIESRLRKNKVQIIIIVRLVDRCLTCV